MKVLDLFSGIGGFSLGLERAGMETVAFCEIDEHCHKVLKKHWPHIPILDDVSKADGYTLNKLLGGIDVICGGFPCQDISVAGKQKGLIDESGNTTRSGLWFQYARLIREIKPRYVIIENVANLRGNGLVTVLQDLWSLGYDAEWHIIPACALGGEFRAPHRRERIWIIAYANGHRSEQGISLQAGNQGKSVFARRLGKNGDAADADANGEFVRKQSGRSEWSHGKSSLLFGVNGAERFATLAASFNNQWQVESSICRMDDGLSAGLYESERFRKQRIKQLGNSIVPQIAEILGRAIMKHEHGTN